MSATRSSKAHAARVIVVATLALASALVVSAPPAQADWWSDWFGSTTTTPSTTTTAPGGSPTTTAAWWACWWGCPAATTTTTTTTTTAPTTTTTAPPLVQPCPGPPKPGGGWWECAFADEFDGSSLDRTKWTPQLTAANSHDGGLECFIDSPNNIAVSGGSLRLTVRKEAAPINCNGLKQSDYTSGMVTTFPSAGRGFAQAYGRYEIRARVTGAKVKGLHEAIWMWPVEPIGAWPYSGEIDIAEIYHLHPDRAIPFIHYNNPWDMNVTNNYCMIDDIAAFHTYVLEWTPASLKISYDGNVCIDDPWQPWFPQSGRQPFDQPFFLILTQALGIGDNAFDPVATPLPASTVVDYVRIWR